MKHLLHYVTCIFLCTCMFVSPMQAETVEDSTVVYFRKGYSFLEMNFQQNRDSLSAFMDRMSRLSKDNSIKGIDLEIIVSAGASPEGLYHLNKRLAKKRADNLIDYLQENLSFTPDSIYARYLNIDWDRLVYLVQQDENVPYRDEVLDILIDTPEWVIKDGVVVDGRFRQLGMLREGVPYWWLYENKFAFMRHATIKAKIHKKEPWLIGGILSKADNRKVEDARIESAPVQMALPAELSQIPAKPGNPVFAFGLKTNMLADVLLVPNLGVEFAFKNRWSVAADWYYSWWKSDKASWYWRTYGGNFEARYWFGNRDEMKLLEGHHLGLYGQMFTYDFEAGQGGVLADKWSYAAGISYGYSLPVAKNLNIDFSIGVGYMGGEYKEYEPIDDCYVWKATKQRHWVGPTKLEVSLVWLIGGVK